MIQFEGMEIEMPKTKLEQHEEICAFRYESIEKRMESGSKRFIRMEQMIWGLYILIIGSQILGVML